MRTTQAVFVASVSTAIAAFGFCGSALAQGVPPVAAPTNATAAPQNQLPPVAADAQPAPQQAAPPATDKDKDDDSDDDKHEGKLRFRGGVSGYGGAYLAGGFAIPYGGVEGRLGVQIKNWVAVYAVPAFLVGFRVGDNQNSAVARVSLGFIPEFTVADLWFIGVGPELYAAVGGGTRTDSNGNTGSGLFAGTSVVGVSGRTGFAFGSVKPNRRKMFTIAFDGRLDFFGGHPAFAPGLSLGYDAM